MSEPSSSEQQLLWSNDTVTDVEPLEPKSLNYKLRHCNDDHSDYRQQLAIAGQTHKTHVSDVTKENCDQLLHEKHQQLYEDTEPNQQLDEENRQLHKEKQQLHSLEENQYLHIYSHKENQHLHIYSHEENQHLHEENQHLHIYSHEENQQLREENRQLREENRQLREDLNRQLCEDLSRQLREDLNRQLREENQQLREEKRTIYTKNQHMIQNLRYQLDEEKRYTSKLQNDNQRHLERYKSHISKLQEELKEVKYKRVFAENQQLQLQKKMQKLQKENQRFQEKQQANEKETFGISAQSHQDISHEFQELYDHMEYEVPNNLGIKGVANKQEFWKKCCHLYQTSFNICYEEIHGVFHEALTSITRLSKEEEECGKVMFSRQKNLINAKTAYEYLLKQCAVQLNKLDKTPIVTKVLASLNADNESWLQEETKAAVEICWKMQTVSPPMFLCQPTKHNESWHEIHNKSWHEGPGELIYYRPVVMYTAGGIVAYKGFIGKTSDQSHSTCSTSYSSSDICKVLDDCTTQIETKLCGGCQKEIQQSQETINHNGKYWHEKCLPICSKCKNYVDTNESCKSGKHHYHYNCFKCHHCNAIPTSNDSQSLPDGRVLCNGCCLYCHNEMHSAAGPQYGSCIHKLSRSICFECNKKVEVHKKTKTNHGIVLKTCICNCQGADYNDHENICSRCNRKRY